MRVCISLFSIVLLSFVLTACDDPQQFDHERATENVRERMDDVESQFEEKRAELEERLQEAEERIRDELEAYDETDGVSREELEELRSRIQESAGRIQEDLQETDRDFEATMRDLGDALERVGAALKEDSDVEPIDHRKLGDLLPREVAGMERYDTDGSTNSVLGIRTSKVSAKYDSPGGDMSITIVDLGSISGAAAVGLDLLDARIDRDFDEGYERTTEIDGYPAYLTVEDKGLRHKHVAVIRVTERFIVAIEAEGTNIDDDIIEKVVDRVSLRRLSRLGR